MQSLVPLHDRPEIWGDEPVDVVLERWWQVLGLADYEPGPAVERALDAECDGQGITDVDAAVARACQPQRCPRAAGRHEVA